MDNITIGLFVVLIGKVKKVTGEKDQVRFKLVDHSNHSFVISSEIFHMQVADMDDLDCFGIARLALDDPIPLNFWELWLDNETVDDHQTAYGLKSNGIGQSQKHKREPEDG